MVWVGPIPIVEGGDLIVAIAGHGQEGGIGENEFAACPDVDTRGDCVCQRVELVVTLTKCLLACAVAAVHPPQVESGKQHSTCEEDDYENSLWRPSRRKLSANRSE